MTTTPDTPDYGDPTEWDEMPKQLGAAITAALEAHGHQVLDAHETAITVHVEGLDEDTEWAIVSPGHHGMWAYGEYIRGHCANPTWLAVDATDPQAIADAVHAVLTGAPLERNWIAGAFAVHPAQPSGGDA